MPPRLLDQLERHARERPDAVAIAPTLVGGRTLCWRELNAAVDGFATYLAARTAEGDVLLICSTNRPEFIVAFLAGLRAGLQVFPVSPSLTPTELRVAASESRARAIVAEAASLATLAGTVSVAIAIDVVWSANGDTAPPRDAGRAALLLHSSGTTGLPKIVVRPHRSVDAVSSAMVHAIGFTSADRVLACVPLCHSYGIEHGLLAPIFAGSTVRLCQGFDLPTIIRELEAGATILPGVPFIYETLARQAEGTRFPALRRAYSAGGPLPGSVFASCRESLGVTVSQLYGATEIGSVTFSDPGEKDFDPASVGRAMDGVDIRIVPTEPPAGGDGQVAIRAASMFDRYLGDEPSPVDDGFFLTGDLGRLDAAGNLTITGRLKLLIDVAGLKVNPLEVESILLQHAGVKICVVVAMPVSETVVRLKAIIVRATGDPVQPDELRQFLKERLAAYKVPRVFEFRSSLPQSPTGKMLRRQVEP